MPLYRDVGEGLASAGIEYYLPLFFEATADLFDYLPGGSTVALPADHEPRLQAAWQSIEERYEERRYDIEHPVLAPAEVFLPPGQWADRALSQPLLLLEQGPGATAADASDLVVDLKAAEAPAVRLDQRREETIRAFATGPARHPGRVLLG